MSDYLETYAYCLLPNHFHLLIRVRDPDEIPVDKRELKHGSKTISLLESVISESFRRFFSAYARAIKGQESRTGSLFQKNFKRKLVHSDQYFSALIAYIHRNPQTHGICDTFEEYPYSSYRRITLPAQTRLMKDAVLNWFGGIKGYEQFHQTTYVLNQLNDLIIED